MVFSNRAERRVGNKGKLGGTSHFTMETSIDNPFGEEGTTFDVLMGVFASTGKTVRTEFLEERMDFLLEVNIIKGLLKGKVKVSLQQRGK